MPPYRPIALSNTVQQLLWRAMQQSLMFLSRDRKSQINGWMAERRDTSVPGKDPRVLTFH